MNKLPKFLVAQNEQVSNEVYVIHTQTPRFIAKVEGNDINIVLEIDSIILNSVELAGIMRRMGDWWYSYLKFKKQRK